MALFKKQKKITKTRIEDYVEDNYDLSLIAETQPQGGIAFKDYYTKLGDGYVSTLTVYQYPKDVLNNWQAKIINREGVIVTMDISTGDRQKIMKHVNRSLGEQNSRIMSGGSSAVDKNKAIHSYTDLLSVATAIQEYGEQMKKLVIRIHVYQATLPKLEEVVQQIRLDLAANNVEASVQHLETKENYLAMFMKSKRQAEVFPKVNFRSGQDIPSTTLGSGYPFNHSSINDKDGAFIGSTLTNGPIYFNMFLVDQIRKSYNMLVLGMMGSGKSTLLKMIAEENFARNNFIRGFDKAGDFTEVIKTMDGKIISLDGTNGMINLLEIMATSTFGMQFDENENNWDLIIDERACFTQHIARLKMQMKIFNDDFLTTDLLDLEGYLIDFYVEKGLWSKDIEVQRTLKITEQAPEFYPTLSEFRTFMEKLPTNHIGHESQLRREKILVTLNAMINGSGDIFDGHTTIPNLEHEQVVFYNIEQLEAKGPNVFRCQLYVALQYIWAQALKNGKKYKRLIETGEIHPRDARRFVVFLDECQNVINTNNIDTVDFVVNFMKEMRKYLAGIILATQSPRQLLPEHQSDASDKIKQIIALTQYKWLFQIDEADVGSIRNTLGDTIRESEYGLLNELKRGQTILSIQGYKNTLIQVDPSKEQLARFNGGQ